MILKFVLLFGFAHAVSISTLPSKKKKSELELLRASRGDSMESAESAASAPGDSEGASTENPPDRSACKWNIGEVAYAKPWANIAIGSKWGSSTGSNVRWHWASNAVDIQNEAHCFKRCQDWIQSEFWHQYQLAWDAEIPSSDMAALYQDPSNRQDGGKIAIQYYPKDNRWGYDRNKCLCRSIPAMWDDYWNWYGGQPKTWLYNKQYPSQSSDPKTDYRSQNGANKKIYDRWGSDKMMNNLNDNTPPTPPNKVMFVDPSCWVDYTEQARLKQKRLDDEAERLAAKTDYSGNFKKLLDYSKSQLPDLNFTNAKAITEGLTTPFRQTNGKFAERVVDAADKISEITEKADNDDGGMMDKSDLRHSTEFDLDSAAHWGVSQALKADKSLPADTNYVMGAKTLKSQYDP